LSLTLTLFSRSQKRTDSKPYKSQGKASRDRHTVGRGLPSAVFHVLTRQRAGAEESNEQKQRARYFEPELVRRMTKGAQGRFRAAQNGIQRAAAASLLVGDASNGSKFLQIRNFRHGLDFNSLRRYNDASVLKRHCDSAHLISLATRGNSVDPQLKQLMKELGDAINESLSESEQISEVVARIKEGGYDIFLVLEATIGVSKQGEKPSDKTSLVTTLSTNPEFKISDSDLKFLKSLRIKIEDK
jgi:hypothetical protein